MIPRRLRRPWLSERTTIHNDNSKIEYVSVQPIFTMYPVWWEHPIRWWKTRHFRADVVYYDEDVSDAFKKELRRREDEAFINGTGGI